MSGGTPYFERDGIRLYHGDCLDHVDVWTGADVLVTDPPYGMGYRSNMLSRAKQNTRPQYDEIQGDGDTTARDAAMLAWGDRPSLVFGTWRQPRPRCAQLIVWDKVNAPGMGDLTIPWGPSHEEIYLSGKGWRIVGKRVGSVLRVPGYAAPDSQRPDHPTPKPTALMRTLIERCPPGVVADPFAGSGSTLVACAELGRAAIGFELEERYCEIAAERIGRTLDQGSLFHQEDAA